MKIEIRKVGGKYVAIKVTVGETIHDLGLHDKEEAESMASTLLSTSLELQELAKDIASE